MPTTVDMGPVPRKIKPVFIIPELTGDAAHDGKVTRFTAQLATRILVLSHNTTDFAVSLEVYPFGKGCAGEPLRCDAATPLTEDKLHGDREVAMSQILFRLAADLSSQEKLRSETGTFMPTVYLISDCVGDFATLDALAELFNNRWFLMGKRWVIYTDAMLDPQLAVHFTDSEKRVKQMSVHERMDEYIGELLFNSSPVEHMFPADVQPTEAMMDCPFDAQPEYPAGEEEEPQAPAGDNWD